MVDIFLRKSRLTFPAAFDCHLIIAAFMPSLLFDPENGSDIFNRNIS
jgi:hypothetical protein